MKKVLKYLGVIAFSLFFLIGGITNVYAATATLEGPSVVRAGDTITLKLNVTDDDVTMLSGKLKYDSSQVTFSKAESAISTWELSTQGNNILAEDKEFKSPLKGKTTVLTLKFKVNSSVKEGDVINISVEDIITSTASGGGSDIAKVSYSVTVAKPLSTNANLASLSVTGATLSPEFKPGTTTYNAGEVDYSVKALDIKYTTEDENAKVTIKNNTLGVGSNTVSIVVTAENGTQKTYKINVTRKQDPNYVAGSNANLKSLKVSQGILSPVFSASVTDYIVYLPYECIGTTFTASGTEADSKAQGVISGTIDKLVEGKNQTVVVCRAEDGTEKSYAITVYVMPKYEGEVPNIGGASGGTGDPGTDNPGDDPGENPGNTEDPTEDPGENPTEEPSENPSENPGTPSEDDDDDKDAPAGEEPDNSGFVTILVILVVIVLVGALIYVLFFSKKKF